LVGPVSYLLLGKAYGDIEPLSLLPKILPIYAEMLRSLARAGATWVQIDEPCLVTDLRDEAKDAHGRAYAVLCDIVPPIKVMLTTSFGGLEANLGLALSLPVHGLHVDLVRAPEQLDAVVKGAREDLVLSLGVIDG